MEQARNSAVEVNLENKINKIALQIKEIEILEEEIEVLIEKEKEIRKSLKELNLLRNMMMKTLGHHHSLLEQTNKTEEDVRIKLDEICKCIVKIRFKEYGDKIAYEEMFEQDEFSYEKGILETIEKQGMVSKLFEKALQEIMPEHPKDEFPLTREMKREFHVHAGPTNSGKTYASLQAIKKVEKGIYLAPLRLLALEVYEQLNLEGVPCHLLTGEERVEVPFANHVSCTIEKANYEEEYDLAIIDEGQMICDPNRGSAWSRAIMGIRAKQVHICCSENAVAMLKTIILDCGDNVEIFHHKRQTPLVLEKSIFSFPDSVKKGDALIVFSRTRALQVASVLAKEGKKASVIYGNLPPETRRKQVENFIEGENDIVISTDAIGMGLNLPIKRIVFLDAVKFDGVCARYLEKSEVKQIAGRAGRRGMYDKGYVNMLQSKKELSKKLNEEEEKIEHIYISPMRSTILNLPFGTLKERLIAWQKAKFNVPYIEKANITQQISLLDKLNRFSKSLSEQEMYEAINIPFNYKNEQLVELWIQFLESIASSKWEIHKPLKKGEDLSSLEYYYRAIELYYMFSNTFQLKWDKEWVDEERKNTSEDIHYLLKENIRTFKRSCPSCSSELEWSYLYKYCTECHEKRKIESKKGYNHFKK